MEKSKVYVNWVCKAIADLRKAIGDENLNRLRAAEEDDVVTIITKKFVINIDTLSEAVTIIDSYGYRGVARCCEEDEFDINVGLAMAFLRMKDEWFPGEPLTVADIGKDDVVELPSGDIRVIKTKVDWTKDEVVLIGKTPLGKEEQVTLPAYDRVRVW